MSLDYKNYKYGERYVSQDTDTVERALGTGVVEPTSPSPADLRWAAEWLAIYNCEENEELAQAFGNVIAFLELTAQSKEKRSAIAEAKRQYAKDKGIKVSQVRVKK